MLHQRLRRASDRHYSHVGPKHSCVYCGEDAEQIDHSTPASWLYSNMQLIEFYDFHLVSSCADCNYKAGKWFDLTFRERRARIAKAVRREHARLLRAPGWDEDELDEMGFNLGADIVKSIAMRERVKRRLRTLESRSIPEGVPDELLKSKSPVEA